MLFDENEMTELCNEMGIELVENTPDNQKKLNVDIRDLFEVKSIEETEKGAKLPDYITKSFCGSIKPKTETITVQGNIFEIIDAVPYGYMIWNIGDNMPDGYIPLCRLEASQPFDGARNIQTDTLKAIPCRDSRCVLRAAACGLNTISKMRHYIRIHEKNKHPSEYVKSRIEICRMAVTTLEKIKNAENLQS